MNGFTKLFGSLIHSTVWQEKPHVKLMWVTMLAMVNRDGVVEASVPGLAKAAGVTVDEAEDALGKFLSPDPYSRSKEAEGRRIEVVDGGWWLINHGKYRNKMSEEERRERNSARMRTARTRARTCEPVHEVSHAEAESEADPNPERAESERAPAESCSRMKSEPPPLMPPSVEGGRSSDQVRFEAKLRSLSKLSDLDVVDLAGQCATLAMTKVKAEWLMVALEEADAKSQRGEQAHVRHARVVGFIRRARKPIEELPAPGEVKSGSAYREFKHEKIPKFDPAAAARMAALIANVGKVEQVDDGGQDEGGEEAANG